MIKRYEYYVYIEKKTRKEYTIEDLQKKHRLPIGWKLFNIIKHHYTVEIRSVFIEV